MKARYAYERMQTCENWFNLTNKWGNMFSFTRDPQK